MKKWWSLAIFVAIMGFAGCKEKTTDLSGDTPVKVSDFLAAFSKVSLPFSIADTNLTKSADTLTIGYKAFTQFLPDTSLTPILGTNRKMVIHPVGKIEKDKEIYLLVMISAKKINHLVVFVTDKKNRFLAAKELLHSGAGDGYVHSLSINKEPTFLLSKERTVKDNQLQFSRQGWVYASDGYFMIVINDSNEETARKDVIINPLDTLPRKNKYSGDYGRDKKNFISIRDGKTAGSYLFFIYFEKNEGTCTGELKGEMKMKTDNTAQFLQNGDPCVIDFTFEGKEITIKEQGSCGSRRGIKCYFNDTFIKKKDPKPVKKKV